MYEIWKDILNYEGLYQVSSKGRIKNLERQVKCRGGHNRTIVERIRKPQMKKNKYRITTLCNGHGDSKTFSVHQLVAQAFLANFIKGMELNHIDGKPGNNNILNLELSNHSHNQLHAVRIGLKAKVGKTSKYRYVSYLSNPRSKNKWAVCLRHLGNGSYGWKTFATELEAVHYSNELLDSIGDTDRLRNFP